MMDYLEFLGRPYNLVFVAAAILAVVLIFVGRRSSRDFLGPVAGLLAAALTGLTLNGAIHDLGLGNYEARFPWVLAASVALAGITAWAVPRLRNRFFPPVKKVRINHPELRGKEALIVSRGVTEDPGSGRAHYHDEEGTLHLVTCHTSGAELGFGTRVQLKEFDDEHESYLVESL